MSCSWPPMPLLGVMISTIRSPGLVAIGCALTAAIWNPTRAINATSARDAQYLYIVHVLSILRAVLLCSRRAPMRRVPRRAQHRLVMAGMIRSFQFSATAVPVLNRLHEIDHVSSSRALPAD